MKSAMKVRRAISLCGGRKQGCTCRFFIHIRLIDVASDHAGWCLPKLLNHAICRGQTH